VVAGDQVDGQVQRAEHAQAEQVELDEPGGGAVLLVPLQHASVGHAGPLDRTDLDDRPVADDHAAGVDAQVPGRVFELCGERDHVVRHAEVALEAGVLLAEAGPAAQVLGEGVLLAGGVAERPGHVAHRGPGSVGDHVGDLGGVVASVAVVDVLDDLFPPAALDVDVDVGRTVPLG